ncbi:MAG: O-antigen ligase family protein [bacterium]|nr:O-antigen ligase family protein [bacterium]
MGINSRDFLYKIFAMVLIFELTIIGIASIKMAHFMLLIPFLFCGFLFVIFLFEPSKAIISIPILILGTGPFFIASHRLHIGLDWYLMDICLFIIIFSLLLRYFLKEKISILTSPLDWTVTIFLFISVISCMVGYFRGNSITDIPWDFRPYFYIFAFYFLFLCTIKNQKDLESFVWTGIVVFGMIGSIWGIYESVSGSYMAVETKRVAFQRLRSPHEVIYPMSFVLTLSMFLISSDIKKKLILVSSMILSGTAMLLSLARGSWIAFIIGSIFIFILISHNYGINKMRTGILLFTFLCIISILFLGTQNTEGIKERAFSTFKFEKDVAILARILESKEAFKLFVAHPFFGVGLGYTYHFFDPIVGNIQVLYIHNSYLYILTKMGLLGLSALILMLWCFIAKGTRSIKKVKEDFPKAVLIGSLGAIVVLIVKSFTTYHLNTPTVTTFVGVIMGIIAFIIGTYGRDKNNAGSTESYKK